MWDVYIHLLEMRALCAFFYAPILRPPLLGLLAQFDSMSTPRRISFRAKLERLPYDCPAGPDGAATFCK